MTCSEKEGQATKMIRAIKEVFPKIPLMPTTEDRDMYIAVSLSDAAHQAFSAYKSPRVSGLFQMMTPNPFKSAMLHTLENDKQHILYVNQTYMKSTVAGVLKIRLLKSELMGDAVRSHWWEDTYDPYVMFSVGSHYVKSETLKNVCKAGWNSTHYLVIPTKHIGAGIDDQKLHFALMDNDWEQRCVATFVTGDGWQDDVLGTSSIDLTDVMVGREQLHEHSFSAESGTGQASLTFTTELIDFETAYSETSTQLQKNASGIGGKSPEEDPDWMRGFTDGEKELSAFPSPKWADEAVRVPLDPVVFITAPKTDTQVWVCVNRGTKSLTVSFRGTEFETSDPGTRAATATKLLHTLGDDKVNDYSDIFVDLDAGLRVTDLFKSSAYVVTPSTEALEANVRVHNGFLKSYSSIRDALMQIIHDITDWSRDWIICVTGHSLGGALATLCAVDFSNLQKEDGERPLIKMINFACPRVGNDDFVDFYCKTVPETYRCVEVDDPIPTLPPRWMGYRHVSPVVRFGEKATVIDRNVSDENSYIIYSKKTGAILSSKLTSGNVLRLVDGLGRADKKTEMRKGDEKGLQKLAEKHLSKNYFAVIRATVVRHLSHVDIA